MIRATLNYCIDTGQKPVTETTGPGGRLRARSGGRDDPREVEISDMRGTETSLDREGFVLVDAPTKVRNFWDESERKEVYDPEVHALLARVAGAKETVVFDHTLRSCIPDRQEQSFAREPVQVVHNDYTLRSAPWRLADVCPEREGTMDGRRWAVIQVWKPIENVVEAFPLAICDGRTLSPDHLVPAERRHPTRVGEIYQVRYDPAHRWSYAPRMRPDEALVFKVYDSATEGRTRFGAHTSFEDPTTSPDAAPRQSIEVRALVFF